MDFSSKISRSPGRNLLASCRLDANDVNPVYAESHSAVNYRRYGKMLEAVKVITNGAASADYRLACGTR
jgi:multidrug efflux pump subunit AcrA (membrane-fusion protein)